MEHNRQIILSARPRGMVGESDFSLVVSDVKYPGNGMVSSVNQYAGRFEDALIGLFKGENIGKLIVKVAD